MHREFEDERLRREDTGYLVQDNTGTEEGCDPDVERCAPDEYSEDPHGADDVPGTPDDLPYSHGEQLPDPADEELSVSGETTKRAERRRPAPDQEPPIGAHDEAELWRHQKPLIDEDEDDGLKLEGFEEDEIPDILEAMGDDAAEALPDSPGGTSATGSVGGPEHGGFPERGE